MLDQVPSTSSCRCHARIKSVKVILLVVLNYKRMQLKKIARKQELNNIIVVLSSKSKYYFINDLQKPHQACFISLTLKLMSVASYFKTFMLTKQKRPGYLCICFDPRVKHGLKRGCIQNLS